MIDGEQVKWKSYIWLSLRTTRILAASFGGQVTKEEVEDAYKLECEYHRAAYGCDPPQYVAVLQSRVECRSHGRALRRVGEN